MSARARPHIGFLVSLTVSACGDPLDRGQVIDGTRVLGAKVSVESDPARAWPEPGETAIVEWLVVSDTARPPFGWGFFACAAADVRSGLPGCRRAPFAAFESDTLSSTLPSFSMAVPEASALGADAITLIGSICVDAPAVLDLMAETARCDPQSTDVTLVSAEVQIGDPDRSNANPTLADDRIELSGEAWEPSPEVLEPGDECAGSALRSVRAGSDARAIRFVLTGDDREPLPPGDSLVGDARETLTLSHFSTGGEIDRQFSVIEAEDASPAPSVTVEWTPPGEAPAAGVVIRFVFVLRDGRGGTDWTFRDLCVAG